MIMSQYKAILIVLDGIGDRPIFEFDNKTPLQSANTPNLDKLVKEGSCGIMDVLAAGIPVGSDLAHLILFGYHQDREYPGRGPLEALGVGIDLGPNSLALRGNLAYIDSNKVIIDRRAGRDIPEADDYIETLKGIKFDEFPDISFEFKHSTEQRVACIIKGKGLSAEVSSTNPNKNYVPIAECVPLDGSKEAKVTAKIINLLSDKIIEKLKGHPHNQTRKDNGLPLVNSILFHGAGISKQVESVRERHAIKVACVTGNGLIKGVCRYIGIELLECEGATGTVSTNLKAKVETILENYENFDLTFLHIKGTDSPGHDRQPEVKRWFIERVDTALGELVQKIDEHTFIFITGDHSTPCNKGDHSGDPVPILMWGPTVLEDHVNKYDEINCASGYLSRINGSYYFNLILNKIDKLKKFGA